VPSLSLEISRQPLLHTRPLSIVHQKSLTITREAFTAHLPSQSREPPHIQQRSIAHRQKHTTIRIPFTAHRPHQQRLPQPPLTPVSNIVHHPKHTTTRRNSIARPYQLLSHCLTLTIAHNIAASTTHIISAAVINARARFWEVQSEAPSVHLSSWS